MHMPGIIPQQLDGEESLVSLNLHNICANDYIKVKLDDMSPKHSVLGNGVQMPCTLAHISRTHSKETLAC